jgi:hypothetical protein
MGSKVVEISASGYVGLNTPRKVAVVIIEVAWRLGKTNLYVDDVSYSTFIY